MRTTVTALCRLMRWLSKPPRHYSTFFGSEPEIREIVMRKAGW